MNEHLMNILRDATQKIETFQNHMKNFEQHPMVLVTDVFTDNDILLPLLIQRYGDDVLLEMQQYWYQFFLPAFQQYLGVDGITLLYDPTIYPAHIQICMEEEIIAYVDIVGHRFERTEPAEVTEIRNRIHQINQEIKELEKTLQEIEPATKNILYLGGANPFKLLDISVRKNKYKSQLTQEIRQINGQFMELEQEKIQLRAALEAVERNNVERDYVLDRIERQIRKLPGYDIPNGEEYHEIEEIEGLERRYAE